MPSLEALQQGRDFKIIELNGVTSEATSIYDPSNSVFAAYRVLCEQWRIAAKNRGRGSHPTSFRALLTIIRQHVW